MSDVFTNTDSIDFTGFATKVVSKYKSIRYCGIVDRIGNIRGQAHRSNSKPILTLDDWSKRALHYTMRYSVIHSWEKPLGNLEYNLSKYSKLITASTPIGGDFLLIVSFDHDVKGIDSILTKNIIPMTKALLTEMHIISQQTTV